MFTFSGADAPVAGRLNVTNISGDTGAASSAFREGSRTSAISRIASQVCKDEAPPAFCRPSLQVEQVDRWRVDASAQSEAQSGAEEDLQPQGQLVWMLFISNFQNSLLAWMWFDGGAESSTVYEYSGMPFASRGTLF